MRKTKPIHGHAVGYPDRKTFEKPACDADRRRFLRQIALGTGACMVGLPRLGHAQSLPVDFDKLGRHPSVATVLAEGASNDALADRSADAPAESDLQQAAPADDQLAADSAPEPALGGRIQEDRALWVEPGYLVLLRWSRPATDNAPVAALEGAADEVQQFLTSRITRTDQIHNLELLHPLELELVTVLGPMVAPATIEVLHLDHDCRVVCAALDPGTTYPEVIEVMGDMPAPGWE